MPLTLAQSFPLGRFHATRWNQNPFEDPYGEWPPSPWRLLRALAARWFQYSRETGDQGVELRDRLLSKLAREVPAFNLVDLTCRGVAIKQYQPTAVGWSDAQKKNPGYKRPGSTLVQDHYRAIPPDKPILWMWQLKDDPLDPIELTLLRELLRRTLYFGRAESFCRFEVIEDDFPPSNCVLTSEAGTGNPVLVPLPNSALNLDALLASTDGDPVLQGRGHRVRDLLKQRRIPPGTAWYYATIPGANPVRPAAMALRRYPLNVRILQFAVGGRVYPPVSEWIRITERFRGRTLKNVAMMLTGDRDASFDRLTASDRDRFALLSGKSITGQRLIGHPHAYFVPYPDQFGHPTRLVVFRRTPFEAEEIEAMLKAAEQLLSWQPQGRNWQLRLVSLPRSLVPPSGFDFSTPVARTWRSATPFVSPGGRIHVRKNGHMRPGETPERLLEKLLLNNGFPRPASIQRENDAQHWVAIHETKEQRARRRHERVRAVLPGYRFLIQFPEPIAGPICVGHSCHFGLGLFVPLYHQEVTPM